jgi:hypothetical protein
MKKVLSLMTFLMLSIIGMQAQGTFGLKSGDAAVASGTTEVSVPNITMTWGVTGGADFKGGNKANTALNDVLGATAYCEGNGVNGSLTEGVYAGTVYLFAPALNGTLTVGVVLNASKSFYVKEGTDGTDVAFTLTKADGTEVTVDEDHKIAEKLTGGLVTFSVEAGKTYAVYCTGSKLGYYGFKYEASATPEPIETTATFNFADPNIRENIGTAMTDVKGYIYNETFTADGATLQITAGSAPSRIYDDPSRGQCLVIYTQYASLIFRAPEGKAITKIEFAAAGNSNINKFTASSGAIEGMTWTGNAEGVRFLQGATSYLANAIVTLVDKDAQTTALPAIEYTECENIAAFNALEAGTYAKLKLTDAEVIGISADGYSTAWVQDATGGCWVQYTSLNAGMKEKTKGNGFVYCVKRLTSGNSQVKETEDTPKSEIAGEAIAEYTIVVGTTISEVNVPANLNKVVKLTGASFVATSATAGTLTIGEETISVNNGTATANQQLHKLEWAKGDTMENVTIVAILVAASATDASKNQLLPISMVEEQVTGITDVNAVNTNATIYNLQGIRLNKVQRGLNIVDGKKIVIK